MASSTPGNQVGFARQDEPWVKAVDWVHELGGSTILEQRVFRDFFSVGSQPAIDVVVFYKVETNNPYGFGFVSNERSKGIGGTFRTNKDTATRLRNALLRLAEALRHRHTSDRSQSHVGEPVTRKLVSYIQYHNPSILLEHQFSNYFNKFPACGFSLVTLFEKRPWGFGFLEIPPADSYVNEYKGMIEELKRIVYDGLASASERYLGQGITGSRMTHSVQQQRGERGRGSAASEEIFNTALNTSGFQPTAGVTHYEALNTPSWAHSWSGFQTIPSYVVGSSEITGQSLSGSLFGGHPNSTQRPGSINVSGQSYNVMQHQPQSFLRSQPTARVIPHAAINSPSGAHFWSGMSSGVTGELLSDRLAGQQETNQWSGSAYGGGYSYNVTQQQQPEPSIHTHSTAGPILYAATNTTSSGSFGATDQFFGGSLAGGQYLSGSLSGRHPNSTQRPGSINVSGQSYNVMQHQPQSFLHSQPTAGVIPHAAINRPFDAHFWSDMSAGVTGELLSDRLAGQQETNQWAGSTHGAGYSYTVMQQPPEPSIRSQSTAGPISYAATNTSGGSFGASDQFFSGSLAGGQPTTSVWSRAVGANRRVQNREAGSSAVYPPEWNMWK